MFCTWPWCCVEVRVVARPTGGGGGRGRGRAGAEDSFMCLPWAAAPTCSSRSRAPRAHAALHRTDSCGTGPCLMQLQWKQQRCTLQQKRAACKVPLHPAPSTVSHAYLNLLDGRCNGHRLLAGLDLDGDELGKREPVESAQPVRRRGRRERVERRRCCCCWCGCRGGCCGRCSLRARAL